jgi:hypothetical protein
MRTPGVLTCDVCGAAIKVEAQRIRLYVPLTADLRARVLAELPALPIQMGAVLGLQTQQMPSHWEVDVCGCIVGLLPMLPDILAREVAREIAKHSARQSAALEPLHRLDDL